MKYIHLLMLLSALVTSSCVNKKREKLNVKEQNLSQTLNEKDEIPLIEGNSKKKSEKDVNIQSNINLLEGSWAENEDDNALFFIEGDSLFYVEDLDNPVRIKLNADTLFIYGDVISNLYIKKLTKDSLWFYSNYDDELTKLCRR